LSGEASGSPLSFTATAVNPSAPTEASVSVGDNLYAPETITVAVGGRVTWTWTGRRRHNVTLSEGSIFPPKTSGTFSHRFLTAGTYTYQCLVHGERMKGTVIVR
jgi:plastocyanin